MRDVRESRFILRKVKFVRGSTGGRKNCRGTNGSNPSPSSGESANFLSLVQDANEPPSWAEAHRRLQQEGRRARVPGRRNRGPTEEALHSMR